jgi:CheY-like chemotaxis protein
MAQVGLLEDNARIAKLCATMLHYLGHEVTVYEHARDCLQALAAQDISPGERPVSQSQETSPRSHLPIEVLILDLHMPDIDGVEVLRRLRSHPHTKSLPLIFCTAATAAEIARALSIAPNAALVSKPFKLQALTSAVNNALGATSK